MCVAAHERDNPHAFTRHQEDRLVDLCQEYRFTGTRCDFSTGEGRSTNIGGILLPCHQITSTAAPLIWPHSNRGPAGRHAGWPAGIGGWYPFKGVIDEPSFYSRALSQAEVQSIVADSGAGKSVVLAANVAPTPAFTGFTPVLATQLVSNYGVSVTDPSSIDQDRHEWSTMY